MCESGPYLYPRVLVNLFRHTRPQKLVHRTLTAQRAKSVATSRNTRTQPASISMLIHYGDCPLAICHQDELVPIAPKS